MKTLIIGKHGAGKTTLIKIKLIPLLTNGDSFNHLVFDICDEYPNHNRITFTNLSLEETQKKYLNAINNCIDDTLLILDDTTKVFNDYSWLKDAVEGKNIIMVMQSVKLEDKNIPDIFDEIYLFPTIDSSDIFYQFIEKHKTKIKHEVAYQRK